MLAHTNVPFKGHSEIRESGKLHSKPLFYYFSLGAPDELRITISYTNDSETLKVLRHIFFLSKKHVYSIQNVVVYVLH